MTPQPQGRGKWREVSKSQHCPACDHQTWCAWTPDGQMLKCERTDVPPSGMILVKPKDAGGLFRHADSIPSGSRSRSRPAVLASGSSAGAAPSDWGARSNSLSEACASERLSRLAASLGVGLEALKSISAGWASSGELVSMRAGGSGWKEERPDGAFTFPERDGKGRIVGLSLRATDGRKGFPSGARRGLVVPHDLAERPDPVFVVEGASDVAACLTLGLAAVGRPSNSGGSEDLAVLLLGRKVLVLGERDQKASGAWPGRDGAVSVATKLGGSWGDPVQWALPPDMAKDVRAWMQERLATGLDLADAEAVQRAGVTFRDAVSGDAKSPPSRPKVSQSELIVRLAHERYRLGRSEDDEAFAVELEGSSIAVTLRGSKEALRSALSRDFRRQHGRVPSSAALTDAIENLRGEALECEPEPVHLRVARDGGRIVLDLGDSAGRAVVVDDKGWRIERSSPVLFRRTALTGRLPDPDADATH